MYFNFRIFCGTVSYHTPLESSSVRTYALWLSERDVQPRTCSYVRVDVLGATVPLPRTAYGTGTVLLPAVLMGLTDVIMNLSMKKLTTTTYGTRTALCSIIHPVIRKHFSDTPYCCIESTGTSQFNSIVFCLG